MKILGLTTIIVGLATSVVAQRTIQLRPSCDSVTIPYASGWSTPVDVINLPYKVEVAPSPGLPVHPILSDVPGKPRYRHHDGGPKVQLLDSVRYSKRAYAAELGSAGASSVVCTASVWGTWLSAGAQCRHDAEFLTDEQYQRCQDKALEARNKGDFDCIATLQRRILRAILDCDAELDLFIQAYGGCWGLDDRILSWELYWAHEQ